MGRYLRLQELRTLNEIKGVYTVDSLNNLNIQSKATIKSKHEDKRNVWAGDNLKTDFSKVVFTETSKVMLDGPDGWSKARLGSTRQKSTGYQERTAT